MRMIPFNIEKELENYKNSSEFQSDCDAIKMFYMLFGEEVPLASEIEQQAIFEKRIYFENVNKCIESGHLWTEGEKMPDGSASGSFCCRCGAMKQI